jgi:hypothetical protein
MPFIKSRGSNLQPQPCQPQNLHIAASKSKGAGVVFADNFVLCCGIVCF